MLAALAPGSAQEEVPVMLGRGGRKGHRVEMARVYGPVPAAGHRVLVDRLWPRGVAKSEAPFDLWAKDVAPSAELRKWYGHSPERFEEFARLYRQELAQGPASEALAGLRSQLSEAPLVLVTATRDLQRSGAAVLRDVLSGG